MLDPGVQRFGGWIVRQAQGLAPADPGHPAGPGDEQEAERSHTAHDVRVGALPGPAAWRRDGVELEATGHVVGEDAELWSRTVRSVVPGRRHRARSRPSAP